MACKKSNSQWEALFKEADKDKSGFLSYDELKALLCKNGSKIPDSALKNLFTFFDGDKGDQKISYAEFCAGLQKIADLIKELARLFKKFDKDNSGFLDKNELTQLLKESGLTANEQEIQQILKQADKSGDGKISFEEFIGVCT